MHASLALAAVLAAAMVCHLATAHPEGLECGTDSTTRLALGKVIMGLPVLAGTGGDGNVRTAATLPLPLASRRARP